MSCQFHVLQGTLSKFRINVPESSQLARIEIDGHPLDVDLMQFDDTSTLRARGGGPLARRGLPRPRHRAATVVSATPVDAIQARNTLQALCEAHRAATAGVLRARDGRGGSTLRWLLAGSQRMVPYPRTRIMADSLHAVLRRLPWLVLFTVIAAAAWPLLKASVDVSGWLGTLLAAAFVVCMLFSVPALVCAVLVLSPLLTWFHYAWSRAEKSSQDMLQRVLAEGLPATPRVAATAPPAPTAAVTSNATAADATGTPCLQRQRGSAHAITVTPEHVGGGQWLATPNTLVRISNRLEFLRYEFTLGGDRRILHAGRNWGDRRIFLAEGDQVDIVAVAAAQPAGGSTRLVLSLHNLEDDACYVCHRVMWPVAKKLRCDFLGKARMTFFTRYHASRLSVLGLTLVPVLLAIGLLVGWLANDYHGWWALAIAVPPAVAAAQFIPCWLLDTFWRCGIASKSQRFTERVYRLAGLRHPLKPAHTVDEV